MDQYEVIFKGEVMPTLEPEQVVTAMAKLFNASEEKISALFNGGAHTLKSGLDRAAAEKYVATLKRAGAMVSLRRMGLPARPASPNRAAPSGLSVAPQVGNLLRDDEREAVVPVEVDIAGIELAAQDNSPLQPPAAAAPPAPDTSHISVADSGADLNPQRPPPAQTPVIDTEGMTLAPADVDRLTDPTPPSAHPVPDTSGMEIEPPGEILKAHEKPPAPDAPAIQHDFNLCDPD